MPLERIKRYLRDTIGLEADTVGASLVERAVRLRMEAREIGEMRRYAELIERDEAERQALINELSVPETWFFRDGKPFELLRQHALELLTRKGEPLLRLLSIPCSTGEEAYSIAMTLLDAGIAPERFSIDAVDISTQVVEKARRGLYGPHSFRGEERDCRQRYFHPEGELYRIDEAVKRPVRFLNGNILDGEFMAGLGPYHVIFCRNLLIYFDMENKKRALDTLHRLLLKDGLLFLGHAETGRMAEGLFRSVGVPGAFAYRKSTGPFCNVPRLPRPPRPRTARGGGRRFASVTPLAARSEPQEAAAPAAGSDEEALWRQKLAEIEALADRGDLAAAEQQCQLLLGDKPDLAQCHYLKGTIHLARQEESEAMESFRKALYLDPVHYQALVHLSLLAEKRGDEAAARNYRARALRVECNKAAE